MSTKPNISWDSECPCDPVGTDEKNRVELVSPSFLQPGDVIFFHSLSNVDGPIRGLNMGDYCHVAIVVNFDLEFECAEGFTEIVEYLQKANIPRNEWSNVPVVVHIEHGFEVLLPCQLFGRRLKAKRHPLDKHIDVKRPSSPPSLGNSLVLTKTAVSFASAKYNYLGLLKGGLLAADFGLSNNSHVNNLDVCVALSGEAKDRVVDLFAKRPGMTLLRKMTSVPGEVFGALLKGADWVADGFESDGIWPELVCTSLVTEILLGADADGISLNEGLLGMLPEKIGIPLEWRDQQTHLRELYGEKRDDLVKNLDAGHDETFDANPENCAVPQFHNNDPKQHQSRILELSQIRTECAASLGRIPLSKFADGKIIGPNNLLDADGFLPTTFRLKPPGQHGYSPLEALPEMTPPVSVDG
jgi:hypothetical protein